MLDPTVFPLRRVRRQGEYYWERWKPLGRASANWRLVGSCDDRVWRSILDSLGAEIQRKEEHRNSLNVQSINWI